MRKIAHASFAGRKEDAASGLYTLNASWELDSTGFSPLPEEGTYLLNGTAGQHIQVARLQSTDGSTSFMEIDLVNDGTTLTGKVILHTGWTDNVLPDKDHPIYSGDAVSAHAVVLK